MTVPVLYVPSATLCFSVATRQFLEKSDPLQQKPRDMWSDPRLTTQTAISHYIEKLEFAEAWKSIRYEEIPLYLYLSLSFFSVLCMSVVC